MPQAGINDERTLSGTDITGREGVPVAQTSTVSSGDATQDAGSNVVGGSGSSADTEISNDGSNTQESSKTKTDYSDEEKEVIVAEYVEAALADGLLAFNSLTVKKNFPKSYAAAVEFMTKRANFTPDAETVLGVFLYTPRNLFYEFFDSKYVYININGLDNDWNFTINHNPAIPGFKNRIDTEYAAFSKAFEILETLI